ncbi:MAG: hypothetical protein ACP5IE_05935, partial [Infirmifilum sp.]
DNVLERDFMETVTPLLNKGYFVSLLSKSVISRCCRSLFYAQQLLSTLRGGLNFNRAYGFVNTLYIWQRNILLREARVRRPEISLLDDLGPANLVALHRKLLRHYHIDKVLVKDVRHVYEKFDAMFIYKRLKWYYNDYDSLATKKDYLTALLVAPLTVIAMAFLTTYLGLPILFLLITYGVLTILTEKLAQNCEPHQQIVVGIIGLPILILLKSILFYVITVETMKRRICESVKRR